MRLFLFLCSLTALAAGQQLRVKSANAHSVDLEWTGATGPVAIERTSGTVTQKIATSEQGHYQDMAIDQFATYRYRVSIGAAHSSDVTVGPPPTGVLNAAPLPKGTDAVKYGQASAMALDENGDPVIAFEWADPNGDNDYSDSEIRFVRWSRANYKWLPTVRVQVVGEISNQNLNPLSIACDRKTGLLAIGTPVAEKGASILLSSDGGLTWSPTPIPGISGMVNSVAVAIVDEKIHAVLTSSESGARYLSGPVKDVSSWKSEGLPLSSGWKPQNINAGLAMDTSGKPVIAWMETQEEGDGLRFEVWRPGKQASTAFETKKYTDYPNLAIATGGGKVGLLLGTPRDGKDPDHGVSYMQSMDGATWTKPSTLPVDGPRSTNPPLDVAIDSKGRIAALFGSNSGSATTVCNFPVFSRSNDGAAWKTCGLGKAEGAEFGAQPATLHIIEADNDKAFVLWQEPAENKFQQGMLLWHEH